VAKVEEEDLMGLKDKFTLLVIMNEVVSCSEGESAGDTVGTRI
jgi:hypothetical protein